MHILSRETLRAMEQPVITPELMNAITAVVDDISLDSLPHEAEERHIGSIAIKVVPLHITYDRMVYFYEAHRTIIDVHYCLDGGEVINVADTSTLQEIRPYDEVADVTIYAAPDRPRKTVALKPGELVLLHPEDAHQPLQKPDGVGSVTKCVIKVPLDT